MDYSKLLKHCRDEHGVKVDTSKLGEMIRFAIFQYFNQEHDKPLLEGELWEILEQLQKVRTIEDGFPTGIEAANGQMICVGDEVGYVEETEDPLTFTVVFEGGCFRKKYHHKEYKTAADMPKLFQYGSIMKIVKKADASPVHGSQTKIEPSLIQRLRTKALENIQEGQNKNDADWGYEQGVLLSNGAVIEICDALENIAETIPDYGTGFRPNWEKIDPEYNAIAIDESGKIYLFTHKPRKDAGQWWINSGMGSGTRRYPFTIKGPVENWQECIWQRPGSREKEGTE